MSAVTLTRFVAIALVCLAIAWGVHAVVVYAMTSTTTVLGGG